MVGFPVLEGAKAGEGGGGGAGGVSSFRKYCSPSKQNATASNNRTLHTSFGLRKGEGQITPLL